MIKDVRGRGLLNCLELKKGVSGKDLSEIMRGHGVLIESHLDNIIRFTPPLVITKSEVDETL
jgi:acetylornithine/succinyldiaminopimelate/putrescine aminotransferase